MLRFVQSTGWRFSWKNDNITSSGSTRAVKRGFTSQIKWKFFIFYSLFATLCGYFSLSTKNLLKLSQNSIFQVSLLILIFISLESEFLSHFLYRQAKLFTRLCPQSSRMDFEFSRSATPRSQYCFKVLTASFCLRWILCLTGLFTDAWSSSAFFGTRI